MGQKLSSSVKQSVYLDTNLYIYFLEQNANFSNKVEKIFNSCIDQGITIYASSLLITELLVAPYRQEKKELIFLYQQLDKQIPGLKLVDFNKGIAVEAARIRAQYNILVPDAIHLATALELQAQIYYTADKQLSKFKEIKVKLLS